MSQRLRDGFQAVTWEPDTTERLKWGILFLFLVLGVFFTPSNHRIPLSGAFKWLLTKAIIRLVIGRADLFHFLAGTEPRDALAAVRFFVTFPEKLIMKHLTYHKLLIYILFM